MNRRELRIFLAIVSGNRRAIALFFISVAILASSAVRASDEALFVERAVKETTLIGYTRSIDTMTISSEVAGRVIAVNYEVGDPVGDNPFVEVDPTFVDFDVQGVRRSLQLLENKGRRADERVKYLQKEFTRIDTLHKGDRATEVRRDEAEQQLIQARLESEAVAIEVAKLKTDLEELLERKRRHKIFAPKGWIVVDKLVETGELVMQGSPLARAADYRTLTVPISASEKELAQIRELPDQFDALLDGLPVKAHLRWVNPEFDEKTRKLATEFAILGYSGEKRGGLRFALSLKLPAEGIQVPKEAVVSRYENPTVTVKSSGEKINVLVLGESDGNYLIGDNPELTPGTELARPQLP